MNTEERKAFNSQFWRFLWSAILIALSGCLGNVVDAIIVGNLIGEDAVSAINLTRPVVQFMYTLNMLLATGAGILVGVEIGKKDMSRAAYFYTLSMVLCLIVGLLLSAAGLFCPGTVTGWLCSNAHLFPLTFEYLSIMLIGAPAYMMMWALSTMVGVDGSPRLVSIAILIDNAVNLSLDIVFIQWLGWGIGGSSTATIVGHIVGIAIMFWHFRYKDNHLRLLFGYLEMKFKNAFSQIISQGAPLAIASVCLTLLLYNANSVVLGTLGRTGIFAFAVCMNLLQIYNLFLAGVCRTIQSLGAIQVGKGDNEAFRLVLRKSFSFITVAMILICIVVWVDPNVISRLFGASDPAILAESNHALRIFSLSFIPFCYIYAIMIVYKLYAHHRMALFISFALSLTVIPVLWLVSKFAPGLLWYSYLIAYIIEIAAILVLHHIMHAKFELVLAATLVCGASMFTACSNNDDPATEKGQLLEVYDVQGSAGKARLTVDGKVLFVTDVLVGKNGLGKTGEGDAKTPVGTLRPLSAFGIKPNPGTTMPYINVTPSTYACDEDCEYYNQIIDTAVVHHPCKGEEMYSYQPQYNYGIATDFNKECIYPNGSAIFIHVKGSKPYTGGCIAFDEDRMVEILKNCDMTLVIKVME